MTDPSRQIPKEIEEFLKQHPEFKVKMERYIQAEKLAALSRLVSGMAHEINNPLTAVIGYSQLLIDSKGQDMDRQLVVIRDQAMRCGKIIQDLLGFARKRKPQMTVLNICAIVDGAVDLMRQELELYRIRIVQRYSGREIRVSGDNIQLQKIFINLFSNAIHALENKQGERKIEIKIVENEKTVEITVADNGCGIAEEHLSRIYEPFFTTKEIGKGSGLGLSLCHGFIAEHGGTIAGESRAGHGAAFTVHLPLLEPHAPSRPAAIPKMQTAKAILIVEDEQVVAGFVRQILSSKGYQVETAHDGVQAREAILTKNYDLILCDYRIPKMNGFELYKKIFEERPEEAKKFVFMTASLHFAQNHGGEDFLVRNDLSFLQKPFTATDLTDLVKRRLGAKPE